MAQAIYRLSSTWLIVLLSPSTVADFFFFVARFYFFQPPAVMGNFNSEERAEQCFMHIEQRISHSPAAIKLDLCKYTNEWLFASSEKNLSCCETYFRGASTVENYLKAKHFTEKSLIDWTSINSTRTTFADWFPVGNVDDVIEAMKLVRVQRSIIEALKRNKSHVILNLELKQTSAQAADENISLPITSSWHFWPICDVSRETFSFISVRRIPKFNSAYVGSWIWVKGGLRGACAMLISGAERTFVAEEFQEVGKVFVGWISQL